jgi:hypothetical protein
VDFCAYHNDFTSTKNGTIPYGVIPDQNDDGCDLGCAGADSYLDDVTVVTSHELVESITDPTPSNTAAPAFPTAWMNSSGYEIGDLCVGIMSQIKTATGSYAVQQEYNNSTNSCNPGPWASP